METNSCETNHLDSNVILPPRKRLLAGLKKRNSDLSTSSENDVFDTRIDYFFNSHFRNPNISLEEVVRSSKTAAASALEFAVRARAVAQEKAEIAAMAMTAAKRALDLVAFVPEDKANKQRYLKKNRMEKHHPVQILYNKKQSVENSKRDEGLAHNPHHAMNSSA